MSLCPVLGPVQAPRFPRMSGDEPCFNASASAFFSFPRVSGDEPLAVVSLEQLAPFSPRKWG